MRRKIKLAWIENDTSRKASFKKRKAGLMKKVRELTTLCDISACLIIYGPDDFYPAAVWPNEEEASSLIRRFMLVPVLERSKKMINQEDYLKERASKMAEQLRKMNHKNSERTASSILHRIEKGTPLEEFGTGELARVVWMLDEKIREIGRRIELSHQPLPRVYPAKLSLPPPTEEEMSGHQVFPWDWFYVEEETEQLPDHERLFGGIRGANEGNNLGFQPYCGNRNSSRNEGNNTMGFQPYNGNEIGFGIGYDKYKKSNYRSGMSDLGLNLKGNYSQGIRIGGHTNHGINVNFGGNIDSVIGVMNKTNINNSSVGVINLNHYEGNNSSSNEGGESNKSGLDEIGGSMASGMRINGEPTTITSSSGGTSGGESGDEDEAETSFEEINKYWPAL